MFKKADSNAIRPQRVKWPFKNMQVGEAVEFEPCLAQRAQLYAHVYGRQSGKKFYTSTQPGGAMYIERIA